MILALLPFMSKFDMFQDIQFGKLMVFIICEACFYGEVSIFFPSLVLAGKDQDQVLGCLEILTQMHMPMHMHMYMYRHMPSHWLHASVACCPTSASCTDECMHCSVHS